MTKRRMLFVLATMAVILAWGTDPAQAERLGAAFRGPANQAADSNADDADAEDTDVDTGNTSQDVDEGETGGLESGGSEGGGEEGGGEEGGGEESGGPEAPSGDDLGGGETGPTQGNDTTGAPSEGGDTGLSGGTGGKSPGGGGGVNVQKQFQRVLWYFAHNRERFLNEVAAKKNARVPPLPYTSVDFFTEALWDARTRAAVTAEDRQTIFDLLKKQATLADDSVVRDAAVLALGKMGTDEAVDVLLDRWKQERDKEVKQDILLALGLSRSEKALVELTKALGQKGYASFALFGLGLSRNTERAGKVVHKYFQSNVKSKKANDRLSSACVALGALRYEPAVNDLAKVVKSKSQGTTVRVYAAQALGRIGGDKARKSLESALKKSEQEVERSAALALGEFTDARVLKALSGKGGLGSSDPLVSGFAAMSMAEVMGQVPESEWKKYPDEMREIALKPAKDQIKSQYASLALAVFGGIDNEVRSFMLKEIAGTKMDEDTRAGLAMSCGVAGLGASESALLDVAESSARGPDARSYAAMAYGMVAKDSNQAAKKLQALYSRERDKSVKRGALFGLGLVGDRRNVGFLLSAIKTGKNDRFTRGAAAVAIGMIRDGKSVDNIAKLLQDPNRYTRAFAVAALGYMADKDPMPVLPEVFARNNFRREFSTLKTVMSTL